MKLGKISARGFVNIYYVFCGKYNQVIIDWLIPGSSRKIRL
jgi:hypothetical protein